MALVDDHPVVLSGLQTLLAEFEGLEVVGTATNGADTVDICRVTQPDVLLLDLRIAPPAGPALVSLVREVSPTTQIVLLSTEITAKDIDWATRAGVAGFVLKGDDPGQIAAAVRRVAAGSTFVSPELSDEILQSVARGLGGGPAQLTERERDTLRLLVDGLSNREIARSMNLSERTVKAHLTSVFRKLGVRDRTGAVSAAIRLKIVNVDD